MLIAVGNTCLMRDSTTCMLFSFTGCILFISDGGKLADQTVKTQNRVDGKYLYLLILMFIYCYLQINGTDETRHGLLEIALGAHYLTVDGSKKSTPELENYIGSFPDWALPLAWPATYESWSF